MKSWAYPIIVLFVRGRAFLSDLFAMGRTSSHCREPTGMPHSVYKSLLVTDRAILISNTIQVQFTLSLNISSRIAISIHLLLYSFVPC